MESREKAQKIAELLDNKKARDIKILDVTGISDLGDFFVICSASSSVQAKALCDEVREKMADEAGEEARAEGYTTSTWILMDYGDVLVHIFQDETRAFYDIERLWNDAKVTEWGEE